MKIASISPINSKSGISKYTEILYEDIKTYPEFEVFFIANTDIVDRVSEDATNVYRLWEDGEKNFSKVLPFLLEKKIDVVHIQFHSENFYSIHSVIILIDFCQKNGIKFFITMHLALGKNFNFPSRITNLHKANMVLVQSESDYFILKNDYPNVMHFPHPIYRENYSEIPNLKNELDFEKNFPIIMTFGFLIKNKNIDQIISAIAKLKVDYPAVLFLALNSVNSLNPDSSVLKLEIENQIKTLGLEENVLFITEFLEDKVFETFFTLADINILAYSEAFEGGSGVLNYCLTSRKPTIITNISTFKNTPEDLALKILAPTEEEIYKGIKKILNGEFVLNTKKLEDIIQTGTFKAKLKELLEFYKTA